MGQFLIDGIGLQCSEILIWKFSSFEIYGNFNEISIIEIGQIGKFPKFSIKYYKGENEGK